MRKNLFFKEDYDGLVKAINKLKKEYKKLGKESTEGSNVGDWHDNFLFEESQRQMRMISRRINDLEGLFHNAEIIDESSLNKNPDRIAIGCKVTLKAENGEIQKYFIGSYIISRDRNYIDDYYIISYMSPLARVIIGRKVNDEVKLTINSKQTIFHVIGIQ